VVSSQKREGSEGANETLAMSTYLRNNGPTERKRGPCARTMRRGEVVEW